MVRSKIAFEDRWQAFGLVGEYLQPVKRWLPAAAEAVSEEKGTFPLSPFLSHSA